MTPQSPSPTLVGTHTREMDMIKEHLIAWLAGSLIVVGTLAGGVAMLAEWQRTVDNPTPKQDMDWLDGSMRVSPSPSASSAPAPTFGRSSAMSVSAAQGSAGLDGNQPVVGDATGITGLDQDLAAWYDQATGNNLTPYPASNTGLFDRKQGWTSGWAAQGRAVQDVQVLAAVSGHPSPTPAAHLQAGEQVTQAETSSLTVTARPSTHPQAVSGEVAVHVVLDMNLRTSTGRLITSTTQLWVTVIADASKPRGYRYMGGAGGTTARTF